MAPFIPIARNLLKYVSSIYLLKSFLADGIFFHVQGMQVMECYFMIQYIDSMKNIILLIAPTSILSICLFIGEEFLKEKIYLPIGGLN